MTNSHLLNISKTIAHDILLKKINTSLNAIGSNLSKTVLRIQYLVKIMEGMKQLVD